MVVPASGFFLLTALHLTYNGSSQQNIPVASSDEGFDTAVAQKNTHHDEPATPSNQWVLGQFEDNALDSYGPLNFGSNEQLAPVEPTLRQVLFLHRHGDRTPYSSYLEISPLAQEPFWKFHGSGQLTNRGKRRVYQMGRLTRQRYAKFLNESVNKNNRISMSSATPRCIESAQLFLSALLSLDSTGSPDAKALQWDRSTNLAQLWQPASLRVVPHDIDGMLAGGKCPEFYKELHREMELDSELGRRMLSDYKHEIEMIKAYYQVAELKSLNELLEMLDTIQIEGSYFRTKMPPQYNDQFYDRCQEMVNLLFGLWQKTTKLRRLGHGLLIDDMLRKMYTFGNEQNNPKPSMALGAGHPHTKPFIHYSAHDSTLTSILGMIGGWNENNPQQPRFASNIAIELHEDSIENELGSEWFIKIFYMQQVEQKDEAAIELHVPGCERDHRGGRCLLSRFTQLMRPYRIRSWQDWMAECGNDLEKVDPYNEQ